MRLIQWRKICRTWRSKLISRRRSRIKVNSANQSPVLLPQTTATLDSRKSSKKRTSGQMRKKIKWSSQNQTSKRFQLQIFHSWWVVSNIHQLHLRLMDYLSVLLATDLRSKNNKIILNKILKTNLKNLAKRSKENLNLISAIYYIFIINKKINKRKMALGQIEVALVSVLS
jgi:hypothetical protein